MTKEGNGDLGRELGRELGVSFKGLHNNIPLDETAKLLTEILHVDHLCSVGGQQHQHVCVEQVCSAAHDEVHVFDRGLGQFGRLSAIIIAPQALCKRVLDR